MFYSPSTKGFYHQNIHGPRHLTVVDPNWQPPMIEVPDPDWDPADTMSPQMVLVPDPAAIPAVIEIDNLDCKIPADAVEITAEDHAALIAGQAAGKQIVADTDGCPLLADPPAPTAAAIWQRIKAERDRRTQNGGYQVAGKWFHSDVFSRSQQIGLLLLGANIPPGLQWKTMDGSFVAMTPALAQQVFAAAAASDQANFAAAETHKAAMEASADPSSYDYTAGWPEVFEQ